MTGDDILAAIIGAVITVVVGLLIVGLQRWLKRRVKVSGPLADVQKEVAHLARIVRCLFSIQRPQLEALSAILEASKGDINGNVDTALESVRNASKEFDDFRDDAVMGTGECKE